MQETTKNSEYFERATRPTGSKFIRLKDGSPSYMSDFIRQIHFDLFDSCLPSDWVYETLWEAFSALEEDKLDECSIETDVYNQDLLDWLKNPFADDFLKEAHRDGLIADNADIYQQIATAQWLAKTAIYSAVNAFNGDDVDED